MISALALDITDGTLIADLSAHAVNGVRWSRGAHGSRLLECEIAADAYSRLDWLTRIGRAEIVLRSQYGERLWGGRLEEVEPTNRGVRLTAMGHWAALNDVLYTGLWSDANVANWKALTSADVATIVDALWMYDQQNRLYVAPTATNTFGSSDLFAWGYIAPSNGQRNITDLDFDYTLAQNGDTDWKVSIDRCDSTWTVLGNIGTITADGSGSKNYTFTGCTNVSVTVYRDNGTPAAISGDAGTVSFEMTSVRIATASSVTLGGVVAAMATYTSGVNANHLSTVTALVATTSDDMQELDIEDEQPGAVIDRLIENSDTAGKFYAGVDSYKRLYMYERHSRSVTYVADLAEDLEFGLALSSVENAVYAIYHGTDGRKLRTATSSNTESIGRYGMTRQGKVNAQATTSATTAGLWRTDALAARSTPQPDVRRLVIRGLTMPDGAPARFYNLRPGDTLRIAGLPAYAHRQLGSLIVDEVQFDSADGGLAVVSLLDRVTPVAAVSYSPLTVYADAEGATSQWTANTGTKVAAVALPDDDITTYIISSNTINQIQQFTGKQSTFLIPAAATVTQVTVTYRVRRGGAIDADCVVGYGFNTPTSTQTGTSGTITSTSSWAGGTYTHSGLSALWNGGFYFYIQNTQARNVFCTTLYATITYTNPT